MCSMLIYSHTHKSRLCAVFRCLCNEQYQEDSSSDDEGIPQGPPDPLYDENLDAEDEDW